MLEVYRLNVRCIVTGLRILLCIALISVSLQLMRLCVIMQDHVVKILMKCECNNLASLEKPKNLIFDVEQLLSLIHISEPTRPY